MENRHKKPGVLGNFLKKQFRDKMSMHKHVKKVIFIHKLWKFNHLIMMMIIITISNLILINICLLFSIMYNTV